MPDEDIELDISPNEDVKESIDKLTKAVESLITLFRTASADIHTEADSGLGQKLDILIKQNQDIAKGILALFELHKEHLPRISRHESAGSQTRQIRRAPMPIVAPVQRIEPRMSMPSMQQFQQTVEAKPFMQPMPPIRPQFQPERPEQPGIEGEMFPPPIQRAQDFPPIQPDLPEFPEDEKPKEKKGMFGFGR
ncbi:hypothetical protein HYV82_02220 [Candidatus Woesearchaeota archaeon]|nr:hypothetical protein [Candidatus Woesearchaeota archaeon]